MGRSAGRKKRQREGARFIAFVEEQLKETRYGLR